MLELSLILDKYLLLLLKKNKQLNNIAKLQDFF